MDICLCRSAFKTITKVSHNYRCPQKVNSFFRSSGSLKLILYSSIYFVTAGLFFTKYLQNIFFCRDNRWLIFIEKIVGSLFSDDRILSECQLKNICWRIIGVHIRSILRTVSLAIKSHLLVLQFNS